ncbi:hypothetical protein [Microvirga zambiensis]|uniref:hypothetical protein n=1 Tax=Microvirga zambiensis TaxID=1402137 RepID=UPI00191D678E|nr:hypothetical protein [Microvirga zambiensis]
MTEAAQLHQRLLEAQEQVQHQVQEMARIEAELDPLLPHPPTLVQSEDAQAQEIDRLSSEHERFARGQKDRP